MEIEIERDGGKMIESNNWCKKNPWLTKRGRYVEKLTERNYRQYDKRCDTGVKKREGQKGEEINDWNEGETGWREDKTGGDSARRIDEQEREREKKEEMNWRREEKHEGKERREEMVRGGARRDEQGGEWVSEGGTGEASRRERWRGTIQNVRINCVPPFVW